MKWLSLNMFEALATTKSEKGVVKFSTTQLTDPHIIQTIKMISDATGRPVASIEQSINDEIQKFLPDAKLAPILYGTILGNIVEDIVFTMFNKVRQTTPIATGGPVFNSLVFGRLIKRVLGEHGDFWPLRGFVDRRPMYTPVFDTLDDPNDPSSLKSTGDPKNPNMADTIKTAAATPNGTFYFSVPFMQSLMDFSHIKGLKPKDKKYQCNGGPYPDEYAYLEFLIMHELMHYSNDDFYYQKIIPNANPTIINWVGDFRSNYTLVKSGFEQLPMGLFNDDINFDRQSTYVEMYNLVKSEFDKLSKDDQNKVKQKLDQMSDDHEPGQEQGSKADPGKTAGKTPADIDKHSKNVANNVESDEQKDVDTNPTDDSSQKSERPSSPGSNKGAGQLIDQNYTPKFNWRDLLALFVKSAGKGKEETNYARQHRRGVSGLDVMVQTGAGAIKPDIRLQPDVDLKLAFVLDVSGSMANSIKSVYANAKSLLSNPMFAKSAVYILKFSGGVEIYKGIFARNVAKRMDSVVSDNMPIKYDIRLDKVFSAAELGGTHFGAIKTTDMMSLLTQGYNVLLISDTDILSPECLDLITPLITRFPTHMFVMLASRRDYNVWVERTKIKTNVTFLEP